MRTILILALVLAATTAQARIQRSQAEVAAFKREQPCPATGRARGACPGWAVDHVEPLCAGGLDKRENMQWISNVDHRFKTLVDERECRKWRRLITTPAR